MKSINISIKNYNHFVQRDKKRRVSFLKNEFFKNLYKSVALDEHLPNMIRVKASLKLFFLDGYNLKFTIDVLSPVVLDLLIDCLDCLEFLLER